MQIYVNNKEVMKKLLLLLLMTVSPTLFGSKVLIMTHSYNRPDFIEIQYKTFKKFLADEYEFVVFNDAPGKQVRADIKNMCKKLGIRCVSIPQEIHTRPYLYRMPGENFPNACTRCADVVQYSLDVMGFKHPGLVMIIDSDMFLIKDFSIKNFMQDKLIAGVPQSRGPVHYLWNGLLFFDMTRLPDKEAINFNCGRIEDQPCDVGGYTHLYFKTHPQVHPFHFGPFHINEYLKHNDLDLLCAACRQSNNLACKHNTELLRSLKFEDTHLRLIQAGPENIEFLLDHNFLHYRGGGNWDNKSNSFHNRKSNILNGFIENLVN